MERTTVSDKVDKTSSLRASIARTLHPEIQHPTRADQANACNRLHAGILSVRLRTIPKLKTHQVRKMETSINRTCRENKTLCDMNPTKRVQCDKQSNLTSSCLRPKNILDRIDWYAQTGFPRCSEGYSFIYPTILL